MTKWRSVAAQATFRVRATSGASPTETSGDKPASNRAITDANAIRVPNTARLVRVRRNPTSASVTNAFDGVAKNHTILET